ncbi:MAG TPA: ABC transporter permease [Mycobacteriales bacterium]|nr:ABC transporter permease [Mycobacteriales bacterium]
MPAWVVTPWRHRVVGPLIRSVLALVGLNLAIYVFLSSNRPPSGVIVFGALIGLLYAMVAMGLILIYRANRIINFAQAEIGASAALLAVLLIKVHHVPYLLAFVIAMVTAVISGAIVELLVIRRFARAPRLVLTVGTIGISLIFAVVQFYIPRWLGGGFLVDPSPPKTPFSGLKFHINPLTFDANSIVIVFAVVLVVAGLWAFFRFTDLGIGIRAAAENADRAKLLGISIGLLSSVTWMLAAALSGLGVFLRIPVIGIPIGADVGPYVLLYALTAAVIARMDSFYVATVAAVCIGIIDQSFYYWSRIANLGAALMLPILLVSMLTQRGKLSRGEDSGVATWSMAKEFRPIPPELIRLPEVEWGRIGGYVLALAAVIGLPYVAAYQQQILAGVIVIYGIVAVSLVMLTGWAGQISLGQWGIAGVGSIMASVMALKWHQDFFLTLLVAGIVGAIASLVIGLPALRVQGLYLAVATLAFAVTIQIYFMSPQYFGSILPGPLQQIVRPKLYHRINIDTNHPRAFYFVCLIVLGLALLSARLFRRSRSGRVIIAARDNERGAASYGVSIARARLTAFVISGFWAAVAGALFAYQSQTVNQGDFDPNQSLLLLTIVVLGGVTSLPGAMLGTAFIGLLKYGGLNPQAQTLASGLGVLLILYVAPGGAAQAFYGIRDAMLRWVADRRGILVPSLVADTREDEVSEEIEAQALRTAAAATSLHVEAGSPA